MTKWIIFNHNNGGYNVIDIDDVEEHIIIYPYQEALITVDDARALIESEDAKEVK